MNPRIAGLVGALALALGLGMGYGIFGGTKAVAQPAPKAEVVEKLVNVPRPITEVACGETYQFDHIERFKLNGRVVVNFYFGGRDRSLLAQYIVDRNVIGMATEIVADRRVNRSLEYSQVTFLCLSDPSLEGHSASNIQVMRYQLTLRRPLVPQTVIRNGGPDRK